MGKLYYPPHPFDTCPIASAWQLGACAGDTLFSNEVATNASEQPGARTWTRTDNNGVVPAKLSAPSTEGEFGDVRSSLWKKEKKKKERKEEFSRVLTNSSGAVRVFPLLPSGSRWVIGSGAARGAPRSGQWQPADSRESCASTGRASNKWRGIWEAISSGWDETNFIAGMVQFFNFFLNYYYSFSMFRRSPICGFYSRGLEAWGLI